MTDQGELELEDVLEIYTPQQREWYRRYGNCYGFLPTASGEPRFTIGPHWPLFVCMFTTILLIGLIMIVEVASEISTWAVVIGVLVVGGCLAFFSAAAVCNPGLELTKADAEANADNRAFCLVCEVVRTPGTMHCPDCDVCVRGFDHHCPWTGKCIGSGNIPYFYGFLMGVLGSVLYVIVCATMKSAIGRLAGGEKPGE